MSNEQDQDLESDLTLFPFPMVGPIFGDWSGIWRVGGTLVATPVGVPCISCHTPILEGEAGGLVYRITGQAPHFPGQLAAKRIGGGGLVAIVLSEPDEEASVPPFVPIHRGCLLLDVLGHEYELCSCNNYDGFNPRRAAAVEMELRYYARAAIKALGAEGRLGGGRGDA